MASGQDSVGRRELAAARAQGRGLFATAFFFSIFVNLLMLTGPIFMLQVYDRVLSSRSEETLVALFALVAFLYVMMGILDYARGRLTGRAAGRFLAALDRRVFSAVLRSETGKPGAEEAGSAMRDLDAVQRFLGSPVLLAIFDMPWTPIFIAAIFIFHPWLGYLAVAGGTILVVVTLLNQWRTRQPAMEAAGQSQRADHIADQLRSEAETVESLGMRGATFERWAEMRGAALHSTIRASDRSGSFTAGTKALRLFLQSAMLAAGAYLVLQGQLTAGAMIAASILLGRALAPVELAIGQWEVMQRASRGWASLARLLGEVPPERPRMALPRPRALIDAQQVTVIPPGESQASLRLVSFRLEPGRALGVIGPSGAGKSTLARAITGVWRCAGGKIRFDGAALDQYDPDVLGHLVGYLPQRVTLFDGTIAENIARMSRQPDAARVVAAAKKADAHEMILKLPQGYDTPVSTAGGRLSGGQVQRVGLARALYGDPVLLVLDEPNSNLDNEGSEALNAAIKQAKAEDCAVMIMAHRPAAIQECEDLMVLDGGLRRAFGPRDEVLREMVQNHAAIARPGVRGGVS